MNCHHFLNNTQNILYRNHKTMYLSINSFLLLYISFTPLTMTSTISYSSHFLISQNIKRWKNTKNIGKHFIPNIVEDVRNLVIYLENFIINDILIGAIVYFLYIQKQAEYLLHQRSIMYQELIQVN